MEFSRLDFEASLTFLKHLLHGVTECCSKIFQFQLGTGLYAQSRRAFLEESIAAGTSTALMRWNVTTRRASMRYDKAVREWQSEVTAISAVKPHRRRGRGNRDLAVYEVFLMFLGKESSG